MRIAHVFAAAALCCLTVSFVLHSSEPPTGSVRFDLKSIPFRLENSETPARNVPESMPGGIAVFDYNRDGRPDLFFTNGANIATLKKDDPKYRNRLFRNEGSGVFTDVTAAAGLAGIGYDMGVAVGDYDNDGYPDLFVAGVYRNTLYHNNGNGTFTDVTTKAGLDQTDKEYGPLWAITGVWVDVNNDGLLDLFVIDYLQWKYDTKPLCTFRDIADYCHPRNYKGTPNRLYLNKGGGVFQDVSAEWGIREKIGKGMGVAVADYDLDGRPDLFVTNDAYYNFLFHNTGGKFEEVAFPTGVALPEDGNFVSGMGTDFRDINNDGYPDIAFVALAHQNFPIFQNNGDGTFRDVTTTSGIGALSASTSGFGAALYDFDNDGWKDFFATGGHVQSQEMPGQVINQNNLVFRNTGSSGKFEAVQNNAGLNASPAARHRGCAFADLDGDGRIDVVVTALGKDAEMWMNRTPQSGHWLDIALEGTKSNRDGIGARIKLVTKTGTQSNHMTTSVGYASSSAGPVHFGLGPNDKADTIEITWPSGTVQKLASVDADRTLKVKER